MSAIEHGTADDDEKLHQLPSFDLEYLHDDDENPKEVTVFVDGADLSTNWITIDAGHAVPLEEVR